MREIEVKYRVDNLEALLIALKSQGIELSEPIFQDDQAYAPAGWQFGDSKLGVSFLRLRTVGDRHYFALKQPADNAQACLEYETEVADRQAMHCAAMHMGYKPTVRIAKTRRVATLEGCSLCVDDVEGVGSFLELERLAGDDANAPAVQTELAALVESLGIAATRTGETYDSLIQAARANVTPASGAPQADNGQRRPRRKPARYSPGNAGHRPEPLPRPVRGHARPGTPAGRAPEQHRPGGNGG